MTARISCGVFLRYASLDRILDRIGHGSAISCSGPALVSMGRSGPRKVGVENTSTFPSSTPKMSTELALPKLTGWSWLPTIITIGMPASATGRSASANCFCCVGVGSAVR